jgi:hypothetical protein
MSPWEFPGIHDKPIIYPKPYQPNMKPQIFLQVLSLVLLFSACKKEKAKVTFQNNSVSNKVYNVVWDGSTITTLSPFTKSNEMEVEPGSHTLVFKVSNTGAAACNPSTPVLAEGDTREFSCSQ